LAWLRSAPPLAKGAEGDRIARIKSLPSDHPAILSLNTLSPSYCADVLSAFHLSGMVESGEGGAVPLSWQELKTMNECALLGLDSWGFRVIRAMSESYCNMSHMASRNNIPPPHVDDYEEFKRYQLNESERIMRANRKK